MWDKVIGLCAVGLVLCLNTGIRAEPVETQQKEVPEGASAPQVTELLKQMVSSAPTTLVGVQVFERQGREGLHTGKVRIYRQAPDKLRLEWGEGFQEVLVIKGDLYLWSSRAQGERSTPRRRPPRYPRFTRKLELDLERLLQNYVIRLMGEEKVANRAAYVVSISGKHAQRPSLRLWLDRENHFQLKMEKSDREGKLVFRSTFEEITFPESVPGERFVPPDEVEPRELPKVPLSYRTVDEVRGLVNFTPVLPKRVPRGFSLTRVRVLGPRGEQARALQLAYGDGLSDISVFERGPRSTESRGTADRNRPRRSERSTRSPRQGRPHRERRLETITHKGVTLQVGSRGGFSIVMRMLPGVRATVMGEISIEELKDMAASLEVAGKGKVSSAREEVAP